MSLRQLSPHAAIGYFASGVLARLPVAASSLATLLLLQAATGSYAFTGLAGAAQGLAMAAGGPAVGALADRFGQRPVAAYCCLLAAASMLALIAAGRAGRPWMLAAAALAGAVQPQIGTLVRVRWARLLGEPARSAALGAAMAFEAAADEASFVLGPALAGLLSGFHTPLGPIVPAALVAALLLAAALPFTLRHGDARPAPTAHAAHSAPLPWRALSVLAGAMAALGTVFGAVQIGVIAYTAGAGHPGAAGVVYAQLGLGSMLAGIACAWLPARFPLERRYTAFAAALLAGTLLLLAGALLHALAFTVALAGAGIAPFMTTLYAYVQRLTPPQRHATALGVLAVGAPIGIAAGRALSGLAEAARHNPADAFAVAALAAALGLALTAPALGWRS